MVLLPPKYSIWQAIGTALSLGMRAIEEVRTLAARPVPPGPPGLGFDDLSMEYDGERQFTVRFARGDQLKEFPFRLPLALDRGLWREDGAYERGDEVTWDGALWIAQDETKDKPGNGKTAWRLARKGPQRAKTLFEIARDNGFVGSESDWVKTIIAAGIAARKPVKM